MNRAFHAIAGFFLAGIFLGCAPTQAQVAVVPPISSWIPSDIADGKPLIFEELIETKENRYIGGTVYLVVDATPEDVERMLRDTNTLRVIFPRLLELKVISKTGGDTRVKIVQGAGPVHSGYVAIFRWGLDPGSANDLRFWLDPQYPHDINDAWGYLRAEPWHGKTLLIYRVRIDLGGGPVRWMFERRVQQAALATPWKVSNYLSEHRAPRTNANKSLDTR